MNRSIISRDFKRNKTTNITLLFFVMLSAFLMASCFSIIVKMSSSINTLYAIANPPHFIQMHKGEIDKTEIAAFADKIDYVTGYHIVDMVDIDGGDIFFSTTDGSSQETSLSESVLDNGFVVNDETYDKLLDLDNQVVELKVGEIGVPVIYMDNYDINPGDTVRISNGEFSMEFTVKTLIRDAQMNSTMCSSTRFLVSENDFKKIKGKIGESEYEIEYFFSDTSYAPEFQTVYENAGLPMNGQAITYTLMKLLSCFSDILLAVVIGAVSLLVIFISVMCLRFTIQAVMEEEMREIGTMRAIGISSKDISSLYLLKYRIIAIAGCLAGYFLSILTGNLFMSHISTAFGLAKDSLISVTVPVLGVCVVYLIVMYSSRKILLKSARITVTQALVAGSRITSGKKKKSGKRIKLSLEKSRCSNVNIFLGVCEILKESRKWKIMFWVVLASVTIIIIPMNLFNTVSSKSFASYMGTALCDISLRLQTADGLQEKQEQIKKKLEANPDIVKYRIYAECRYEILTDDGEPANFRASSGDYSDVDIKYLSGGNPTNDNEISISKLNADLYGKDTGDYITLIIDEEEIHFSISGVYQDVTDGGYTAKMQREYNEKDVAAYGFSVFLKDGVSINQKMEDLSAELPEGIKIMSTADYIAKTMNSLTYVLCVAVIVISMIGICLVALITVLYMKLQMAQQYSQISAMKAIGFSSSDVARQYLVKICLVSFAGILFGTFAANTLGEAFVSLLLSVSGGGISRITFIINPVLSYVVCPVTVLLTVAVATWICAAEIRKYNIINLINE